MRSLVGLLAATVLLYGCEQEQRVGPRPASSVATTAPAPSASPSSAASSQVVAERLQLPRMPDKDFAAPDAVWRRDTLFATLKRGEEELIVYRFDIGKTTWSPTPLPSAKSVWSWEPTRCLFAGTSNGKLHLLEAGDGGHTELAALERAPFQIVDRGATVWLLSGSDPIIAHRSTDGGKTTARVAELEAKNEFPFPIVHATTDTLLVTKATAIEKKPLKLRFTAQHVTERATNRTTMVLDGAGGVYLPQLCASDGHVHALVGRHVLASDDGGKTFANIGSVTPRDATEDLKDARILCHEGDLLAVVELNDESLHLTTCNAEGCRPASEVAKKTTRWAMGLTAKGPRLLVVGFSQNGERLVTSYTLTMKGAKGGATAASIPPGRFLVYEGGIFDFEGVQTTEAPSPR